jgi:hypothetical protein
MAKSSKSSRKARPTEEPSFPAERELIVITSEAAADAGVAPGAGMAPDPLQMLLEQAGASITPLFSASGSRVRADGVGEAEADAAANLGMYYRVEAPDDRLDELALRLNRLPVVEAAYVKPPVEPPQLNDMEADAAPAPPVTPDFTARQLYLDAAPGGVDAHYAWTLPGGSGAGVRIIDIEGEWRFSHEDLLQNQGGVVGGTQPNLLGWRNHGTAVVGEFSADRNSGGVTGICPEAGVRAISIFGGLGSAAAIRQAADMLASGDIILLELHRPGPRHNFQSRNDQQGYIAIEWWPDDFDAIRYAVGRGVIVVEAAGNGAQDLDDPIYDAPALGFPPGWTNPFKRTNRDSGAIMVGAGAPPPGTHNADHGPDRSRLAFSNYGALIDAQGWGREVTTCGYGDLQGGANEDLWYTDQFSGTSSASPIVVGVLGSLQGILRANNRELLTPARARELLRATGSPQTDAPGRPATQRIGNRPDLRQLVAQVQPGDSRAGIQFTGTVPANGTRRWYTHSWPAGWQVVWTVMPVTLRTGASPQITWDVHVQRTSAIEATYWISVTNISNQPVDVEGRFAVLSK